MAVEKSTPTRLRREGRTYTTLPNDSIERIQSAEALAIWCYLQSKPQDWVIRKGHLMERLGLSRRRYASAVAHLRDVGLVSIEPWQDERGRLAGTVIVCRDTPRVPEPVASVAPRVPIPDMSVSASLGESVDVPIKDINTKKGEIQSESSTEEPRTAHPSHQVYTGQPQARDPSKSRHWSDELINAELRQREAHARIEQQE